MLKSHLILILALVGFAANTVRMTASVIEYKKAAEHNVRTAFYLHECWDAETQTNLSTDICVESEQWGEE